MQRPSPNILKTQSESEDAHTPVVASVIGTLISSHLVHIPFPGLNEMPVGEIAENNTPVETEAAAKI